MAMGFGLLTAAPLCLTAGRSHQLFNLKSREIYEAFILGRPYWSCSF